MYCFNEGDIRVHDVKMANKIMEIWNGKYGNSPFDFDEPVLLNETYVISFFGIESDMEAFLHEIIKLCIMANTYLEFDIRYSGDEHGGFYYKTGETDDGMQYLDETDVALGDMENKRLIAECKRRGIWPDAETAYRKQEHEYLRQDADRHLEEYFEEHVREYIETTFLSDKNELIEQLVSMFEDMRDCNVSENDTWDNVIAKYVKDIQEANK